MYNIRYLHYNRNELIYFYEHEDDITNGAAIIWFRMLYNDLYNCIIENNIQHSFVKFKSKVYLAVDEENAALLTLYGYKVEKINNEYIKTDFKLF